MHVKIFTQANATKCKSACYSINFASMNWSVFPNKVTQCTKVIILSLFILQTKHENNPYVELIVYADHLLVS